MRLSDVTTNLAVSLRAGGLRIIEVIQESGVLMRSWSQLAVAACVAVVGGMLIPAASAEDLRIEAYTVKDRKGKEHTGELGYLTVPENRGRKGARMIEIAFVRFKSPLKSPGPPVFVLAGGPGGSGIDRVRSAIAANAAVMLDYFGGDIVGIDQRGTGKSRPNLKTPLRYKLPLEEPGDPAKLLERMKKVCRAAVKEFQKKRIELAGYTTEENADDIDDLRHALGYKKINLWGGSYGSHLAFSIVRRHGKNLDRVVVQSPEGPDHTFKLPSQIHEGLERVAALSNADPGIKDKMPDLIGTLKKVLNRLEAKPVIAEVRHPILGVKVKVGISKFDVQMLVSGAIGRVRTMAGVPKAIYEMSEGDFSFVGRQLIGFRSFSGPRSGMSMMMDAASGATKSRLALMKKEAGKYPLGGAVNFPFPQLAEAWGNPDLGDDFRGPLRSKVPILIICGDLDSRTPLRNAKELLKDLPHGKLIAVKNGAHDFSVFQSKPLSKAVRDFYRGKDPQVKTVSLPKPKFTRIP